MNTPAKHDVNVIPAWLAGYSGKGVTISIIDDGLDHEHPELAERYVSTNNSNREDGRERGKGFCFDWGREFVVIICLLLCD